ncbi:MAG: protein kinase domain-containing protein [Bradymonadaceae bacterium]
MDPMRALPLFCDALEALGEAHALAIIHKDLKPSNLFLSRSGSGRESLQIVDFGIAHMAEKNEARLTATGYMLGTPQYMAPEYVHAQAVSAALDVYQMGLILVETLAGRPVVDHESPWRCAIMHASRDLSIPKSLLDGPAGPVLDKALAFEPTERYANAAAFAEALRKIDPATVIGVRPDEPYVKLVAASGEFTPAPRETGEHTHRVTAEQSPHGPRETGQVFAGTLEQFPHPDARQVPNRKATTTAQSTSAVGVDALPESGGQKRGTLLAIGAVLLGFIAIAIVVLVALVMSPDTESQELMPEVAALDEAEPDEVEVAEVKEEPAIEEVPAAIVAEAEPEQIPVRVVTEPTGAEVFRGSERLGLSPLNLEFGPDEEGPITLVAKLAGHEDQTIEVVPGEAPEFSVQLEPSPTPRATTRTVRPKAKPRVEPKAEPKQPMLVAP